MYPDPKCEDCKGTGEILLLNRSVKCFCLNRKEEIIEDDVLEDPLQLKKLFDKRIKKYNNDFNWPVI
jgi:hypothetical protein